MGSLLVLLLFIIIIPSQMGSLLVGQPSLHHSCLFVSVETLPLPKIMSPLLQAYLDVLEHLSRLSIRMPSLPPAGNDTVGHKYRAERIEMNRRALAHQGTVQSSRMQGWAQGFCASLPMLKKLSEKSGVMHTSIVEVRSVRLRLRWPVGYGRSGRSKGCGGNEASDFSCVPRRESRNISIGGDCCMWRH